jgi:hypothetical protein
MAVLRHQSVVRVYHRESRSLRQRFGKWYPAARRELLNKDKGRSAVGRQSGHQLARGCNVARKAGDGDDEGRIDGRRKTRYAFLDVHCVSVRYDLIMQCALPYRQLSPSDAVSGSDLGK